MCLSFWTRISEHSKSNHRQLALCQTLLPGLLIGLIACGEESSRQETISAAGGEQQGGASGSTLSTEAPIPPVGLVGGNSASTTRKATGGLGAVAQSGASAQKGGSGGKAADKDNKGGSGANTAKTNTGCGTNGGQLRGKTNQTVIAAGMARTFVLYAPSSLDPKRPAPLLIVPHGYTMSGQGMYDITGYHKLADRDGFMVAYPDGQAMYPWYVGTAVCGMGAYASAYTDIDQAFMDEIIKLVDADQCIDKNHIFMSGFSMGGYFSNHNGCINPVIRAIGPHSGGSHDLSTCTNQHRPVILFHFKTDTLIAYSWGQEARDRWIARNGCDATNPDVTQVNGGVCEYYKGCPADGQVAMCSFDVPANASPQAVAGHAWSGGATGVGGNFGIPETESATDLGWAFFKKYAW